MKSIRMRRLGSSALAVMLSLLLLLPVTGLAAQDQDPPGPASTPDRSPTYPGGALQPIAALAL